MKSDILENTCFKINSIAIDLRNNLLQLLDFMVQTFQILPEKGEKQYTEKSAEAPLTFAKKVRFAPQSQVLLGHSLEKFTDQYQSCTGLVTPSAHLEDKCSTSRTSTVYKNDQNGKLFSSILDVSGNQFTLKNQTDIAHFEILYEVQAVNLYGTDLQLTSIAKTCNPDEFEGQLNQMMQDLILENLIHQQVAHNQITRNFGF